MRRADRGSGRSRPAWPSSPAPRRGRSSLRSTISSRRAVKRFDLLDQRHVESLLGGADVVALLLLDLVAAQGADELIAAHSDVAVDAPDREAARRAGGRRGTRRWRGGSWCRRGCRRRRGSPQRPWGFPPAGGGGLKRSSSSARVGVRAHLIGDDMSPEWDLPSVASCLRSGVLAALLALCAVPGSAAAAGGRACESAEARPAQVSERIVIAFDAVRAERRAARHGLRALRLNRRLSRAASRHSEDMARHGYFDHTSQNGASFVDRIRRTGYLNGARSWKVAENIAWERPGWPLAARDHKGLDEQPGSPRQHPRRFLSRDRHRRSERSGHRASRLPTDSAHAADPPQRTQSS